VSRGAEIPDPTTLRVLSGMPSAAASLADSTLIMIDCQNTYTQGVMELTGVQAALDEAAVLLDRARSAGIPVIHIQHDGGEGSPYDVRAQIGAIVGRVAPRDGEPVIVKSFPNSFVQTDLDERLKSGSAHNLILAGFMTHMCVNSTARGASNLGYASTVVAAATATRDPARPERDGLHARTAGGQPRRRRGHVRHRGARQHRHPGLTREW
jgi:nicotinamidase-related amidase